jgi:uridine phosphorylase
MSEKIYKRDIGRAAIVAKVANIHGVSKRFVRMVINDERKSEQVMNTYMALQETLSETENLLLKAVKEAVPFN